MDFSNLNVDNKKEPIKVPSTKSKKVKFEALAADIIEKPSGEYRWDKLSPEERKRIHETEPGYKVPILNYRQIGSHCENCNDITHHVIWNEDKKILRCLRCKKDKKYGK